MNDFRKFLRQQRDRRDLVGELARLVEDDETIPRNPRDIRKHLLVAHGDEAAWSMRAYGMAMKEFQIERGGVVARGWSNE